MTANAIEYNEMFMPTPTGFRDVWSGLRRILSEEGIIDFVAKLSPWLAPLPSAFFVYQATMDHLTTWPALAVTIAIVIETLGLTTTHTALGMHAWNQTHKGQPEKQAPFLLALILALVYVVATLLLIGVLEVLPDLEHYAPAMFPLLAVVGAVNLALRSHHNTRIREEKQQVVDSQLRQRQLEDEERALKHEERRIKTAAKYGLTVNQNVTPTLSTPSIDSQNHVIDSQVTARLMAGKQSKIDSRRDQLIDIVRNNPRIELAELQRQLGLGSANTLKADIRFLVDTGRLDFENRTFTVKG
jgi:hypothetical protein